MKKCKFCFWEMNDEAFVCPACWKSECEEKKYALFTRWHVFCPECWFLWKAVIWKRRWRTLITIVLLCCAIIPWLLYSLRRWWAYYVCPKCNNSKLKFMNKKDFDKRQSELNK